MAKPKSYKKKLPKYIDGGDNTAETLKNIKKRRLQQAMVDEANRRKGYYALPDNTTVPQVDKKVVESKTKEKPVVKQRQAEIKPAGNQRIKDLQNQRWEYVNNPGIMDYVGQTGYMPLLALDNPFTMGEELKRLREIQSDPTRSYSERFSQGMDVANEAVPGALLNVALEGAGEAVIPMARQAGKYLTTQTPLKNTWRYNPWRFKENPNAYYHRSPNLKNIVNQETGMLQGFGESDAGKLFNEIAGPRIGKGINLKKTANNRLYFSKGVPLDYGRYNTFDVVGKSAGSGYKGPYMVEVEGVPMGASVKGRAPGLEPTKPGSYAVSKRPISLDEAKFYEEDWLRGYKPVEVPKNKFKSEIDWAKWNKEIPENKALMQEYNTIEQQAKANGTWMKNPDGSPFQGTPEQFVQQNSQNFKKAFGNSKLINPDGSPTIQYHGSAKKFDTFDESKFQLGDAGYSGRGIYTTPDKNKASSYALSSNSIHTGKFEPTVYELYGQGNNPISAEELIKQNKNYDLFNFHRSKDFRGNVPLEEQLLDYDVAIRNQTRGIERVSPWNEASELVFPTNKQLKSAVGNNGMFDMTNPNIYKALVPATIGTAALENKKHGGYTHNNMAGKINKRKGLPSRFPMYETGGFDYTSLIAPTTILMSSMYRPKNKYESLYNNVNLLNVPFKTYNEEVKAAEGQYFEYGGLMPFANGGRMVNPYNGMPNAEIEGEIVNHADGGIQDFSHLPNHEQATEANEVNLEPGTFIFSKRIKNPMTGRPFATDAKKYTTAKEERIFDDKNAPAVTSKSAKLMFGVKKQLAQNLAELHEATKLHNNAQKAENEATEEFIGMLGGMYGKGGLIKRKDGSYSPRGLWDNIRANRGSGKKPTKAMLEQERKIKAKYADGGNVDGDPPYITKLNPQEEIQFKNWYEKLSKYKGLSNNPDNQYYDMRGYWKENPNERESWFNKSQDVHFTDKYKQPGHPTFSNESIYSNEKTPGGTWTHVEKGNKWYYHPSKYTSTPEYKRKTIQYLRENYNNEEPAFPIYGKDTINVAPLMLKEKAMGGYMYANGGTYVTAGDEYHRIYKNAEGDIMVNHPKEDKGKWDTINLTNKSGAKTVAQGVAATKKWHRENPKYESGGYALGESYDMTDEEIEELKKQGYTFDFE